LRCIQPAARKEPGGYRLLAGDRDREQLPD